MEGWWSLSLREMEVLIGAFLAKQCWRLLKEQHSLAACVLKARYFPDKRLFDANLGSQPNYV